MAAVRVEAADCFEQADNDPLLADRERRMAVRSLLLKCSRAAARINEAAEASATQLTDDTAAFCANANAELDRIMRNKACLGCGKTGHRFKDCRKWAAAKQAKHD